MADVFLFCAVVAHVDPQSFAIGLEEFPYPFEVHCLPLTMEGHPMKMAYMDPNQVLGMAASRYWCMDASFQNAHEGRTFIPYRLPRDE